LERKRLSYSLFFLRVFWTMFSLWVRMVRNGRLESRNPPGRCLSGSVARTKWHTFSVWLGELELPPRPHSTC
jgi:hypothetical protein